MAERSLSDLLRDIAGNIQAIVRSEILLAKAELYDEARAAKRSAVYLVAGIVTATAAGFFALLGAMYGLALVMPLWSAALVVAAALVILSVALTGVARARARRMQESAGARVSTMKEDAQWVAQRSR